LIAIDVDQPGCDQNCQQEGAYDDKAAYQGSAHGAYLRQGVISCPAMTGMEV
jgi:hypothetical protein